MSAVLTANVDAIYKIKPLKVFSLISATSFLFLSEYLIYSLFLQVLD